MSRKFYQYFFCTHWDQMFFLIQSVIGLNDYPELSKLKIKVWRTSHASHEFRGPQGHPLSDQLATNLGFLTPSSS